jgi:hypothetical protein
MRERALYLWTTASEIGTLLVRERKLSCEVFNLTWFI